MKFNKQSSKVPRSMVRGQWSMVYGPWSSSRGVTVVAAILAVMLLGALGVGMIYFVASNQQTRVQQVTRDQAYYANIAAMEFALGQIIKDGSADATFTRKFIGETFTVTRSGGTLTATTTKRDAYIQHSINDPNTVDPTTCLIVNTAAAAMASGDTQLAGITLSKDPACAANLTIISMTGTSWSTNGGEMLTQIQIEGAPVEFSGSAGSGGTFSFGANTFTISDFVAHSLTYIQWGTALPNKNFTLVFNYQYGASTTSKTVNVNFKTMAGCFGWTYASGILNYSSNAWSQLTNTTVSNSCDTGIILDRMTVSWTPTTPAVNLTGVRINSSTIYTGSAATGVEIDVTNQTYAASSSYNVDYFQFDGDMLGRNYTVIWKFTDGSTKTYTFNIFNANENNCLTINTGSVALSGNDITGITIQNTCGADIGITGVTMTWSGGPTQFSGTSINDVRVPANVYSGNFASGALLNFATVNPTYGGIYLTDGSGVKNVDYLRFNSSPANIAMTLTFTMADGTTKSVTFTPQTHAGCLSINMFPAKLGSGNARVQDWTVTNNCGYAVTWVNSTGSTWTGTRNLNSIYVNGSPVWTASVPSGGAIVLSPAYTINAGAVATMDWRYSGTMLNQQVYFKFNMNDGSQASSEFTQKSCLAINTASAAISGAGFTELQGITVRNQCTARSLTWSTVVVTWTVPPNNMTAMTVNAVSVWTGSAIPGATVNHTDVAFTASQQKPINFFRFNGDARTKTFTIRFNMIDGSYYTTPSFSPP